MFFVGTIVFGVLTVLGTMVFLAQIPGAAARGVLGGITFPLRVAWDGASYLLTREKIAWHMARATLMYCVPFYHPSWRKTEHLVARGLATGAIVGAPTRPARGAGHA